MKNANFTIKTFTLLLACWSIIITGQAQTTAFTEISKVTSDARNDDDYFGDAVAIDKDFAVVGETLDQLTADEMGPSLSRAGKINILKKVNGEWTLIQKITTPTREAFGYFGNAVSISGDYVFASEPFVPSGQGRVYIYKRDGGDSDNFSQVQLLQAPIPETNAKFGIRLEVDGDYAVISAEGETASADGSASIFGAGVFYIYQNVGGTWTLVKRIESPNRGNTNNNFGRSVAISGDNIVVGESGYDVVGGPEIGTAYVYNKDTGGTNNWGLVKQLDISTPRPYIRFGSAVGIDGDNVVVGAYEDDALGALTNDYGAVYVYNKDTGGTNNWGEVKKLVAPTQGIDDEFGERVAISGDYIVVGAHKEDEDVNEMNNLFNSGSVYFFKRDVGGANNWGLVNKVTASVRGDEDEFGSAVAIDGCTTIIGCAYNKTDADEMNYNNRGPGAVYFFGNELYTEMAITPATCDADAVVTASNTSGTVTNYEFFEDVNANRQFDAGESRQSGASNTYTAVGLSPTDEVGVIMTNAAGERCETIVDIIKNCIRLDVSVNLSGPIDTLSTVPTITIGMKTDLATANLIPLTEPYTGLSFAHVGDGGGETTTMAVLNDASLGVVDWVFLEVRDPNTPTTVLGTTSALLLKNGKVVDGTGTGFPDFSLPPNKEYHVAVKHRNHLGVMTATPMILNY